MDSASEDWRIARQKVIFFRSRWDFEVLVDELIEAVRNDPRRCANCGHAAHSNGGCHGSTYDSATGVDVGECDCEAYVPVEGAQ